MSHVSQQAHHLSTVWHLTTVFVPRAVLCVLYSHVKKGKKSMISTHEQRAEYLSSSLEPYISIILARYNGIGYSLSFGRR